MINKNISIFTDLIGKQNLQLLCQQNSDSCGQTFPNSFAEQPFAKVAKNLTRTLSDEQRFYFWELVQKCTCIPLSHTVCDGCVQIHKYLHQLKQEKSSQMLPPGWAHSRLRRVLRALCSVQWFAGHHLVWAPHQMPCGAENGICLISVISLPKAVFSLSPCQHSTVPSPVFQSWHPPQRLL